MIKTEMIEKLFVAGEWTDAAASGATFDVANPATNEPIATLPDAGGEEMRRAIDAASAIQKSGPRPQRRTGPGSCAGRPTSCTREKNTSRPL
jgi:hypothetical protein